MKKCFYIIAAVVSALMLMISCEKPVEPTVEPNFPEAVTVALEAGGSHKLALEPNTDWTIELKYDAESAGWFWIQDGNSQAYSLTGKAGDKVEVTVFTGDQTDFDHVHTCTLEMTMGDQTKLIATFTRATIARNFSLAYCQMDEGDYKYDESEDESDIMYAYNAPLTGEDKLIPLEWNTRTKDYRRALLIEADFAWQLKSKPEWVSTLKITEGAAGAKVEVELEGNPTKYPLEDATSEIVFCAADNMEATFTYNVSIPGCGDIFEISGFEAETDANKDGEIYHEVMGNGSWNPAETGLTGSVLGINGAEIFKFTKSGNTWTADAAWVIVTLGEWDAAEGVLQERDLNIKVAANESGAERQALILVMPAKAAPADAASIISGGEVAEAYSDYVVTVISQSNEKTGMVSPLSPGNFGSDGEATFDPLEDEALNTKYGTKEAYILKYNSPYASSGNNSNLCALFAIEDWVAYNAAGDDITGPNCWLKVDTSLESEISPNTFRVIMDADRLSDRYTENTGYLVLHSTEGAQVIIKCVYQEEKPVYKDVVKFVNPDAVTGATLDHVTKDNCNAMNEKYSDVKMYDGYGTLSFNEDLGNGYNVYVLTYTAANPTNAELMIEGYEYNADDPSNNPDNEEYYDANTEAAKVVGIMPVSEKSWLSHSGTAESVTVTMKDPGEKYKFHAMIQKRDASKNPETIIYCIAAFPFEN